MPKINTAAMEALRKKQKKRMRFKRKNADESESVSVSLFLESWRRLIRRNTAVIGMIVFAVFIFIALFPSLIAPEGYDNQRLERAFQPPNSAHIMGTDNLGRDVFSRIMYGARYSIGIGFFSVVLSCAAGIIAGSLAAFYGIIADNIIMRFVDALAAIPSILLAIAITSVLGASMVNLTIAISISSFPHYSRIVRAAVLSIVDREFIEAARAVGASDVRIIFLHILPNSLAPIIVQSTVGLGGAILSVAALSFIGLGIQPPHPEWGTMLQAGREYIRSYWWLIIYPGLFIMLAIVSINLFGDGLRDALDPRLKQ